MNRQPCPRRRHRPVWLYYAAVAILAIGGGATMAYFALDLDEPPGAAANLVMHTPTPDDGTETGAFGMTQRGLPEYLTVGPKTS